MAESCVQCQAKYTVFAVVSVSSTVFTYKFANNRLLIPHVGVRLFLARRYLRCLWLLTERDKALLYAPVSPRYGFEVGAVQIRQYTHGAALYGW